MRRRILQRKEPDCPAIIFFRYSDSETLEFSRTRTKSGRLKELRDKLLLARDRSDEMSQELDATLHVDQVDHFDGRMHVAHWEGDQRTRDGTFCLVDTVRIRARCAGGSLVLDRDVKFSCQRKQL